METEDISTEEFSDVSQDRESELLMKKENEKIEQIQQYKIKLEKLERDELDELKKVFTHFCIWKNWVFLRINPWRSNDAICCDLKYF